jgi:carbonyl reductase 1
MISPYNFTKVGLIALTRIQQKNFDAVSKKNILVNAVCPGLVKTDMNPGGKLIPEQGAETPVFLALLSNQFSGPSGRIWADKVALDWTDMNWKWH